jgi:hypothetical protein
MGWRNYQTAEIQPETIPSIDPLQEDETEYFRLLKRWEEIDDDPTATSEEARDLLASLEILFQELHRQGRNVPVKLPLEKRDVA